MEELFIKNNLNHHHLHNIKIEQTSTTTSEKQSTIQSTKESTKQSITNPIYESSSSETQQQQFIDDKFEPQPQPKLQNNHLHSNQKQEQLNTNNILVIKDKQEDDDIEMFVKNNPNSNNKIEKEYNNPQQHHPQHPQQQHLHNNKKEQSNPHITSSVKTYHREEEYEKQILSLLHEQYQELSKKRVCRLPIIQNTYSSSRGMTAKLPEINLRIGKKVNDEQQQQCKEEQYNMNNNNNEKQQEQEQQEQEEDIKEYENIKKIYEMKRTNKSDSYNNHRYNNNNRKNNNFSNQSHYYHNKKEKLQHHQHHQQQTININKNINQSLKTATTNPEINNSHSYQPPQPPQPSYSFDNHHISNNNFNKFSYSSCLESTDSITALNEMYKLYYEQQQQQECQLRLRQQRNYSTKKVIVNDCVQLPNLNEHQQQQGGGSAFFPSTKKTDKSNRERKIIIRSVKTNNDKYKETCNNNVDDVDDIDDVDNIDNININGSATTTTNNKKTNNSTKDSKILLPSRTNKNDIILWQSREIAKEELNKLKKNTNIQKPQPQPQPIDKYKQQLEERKEHTLSTPHKEENIILSTSSLNHRLSSCMNKKLNCNQNVGVVKNENENESIIITFNDINPIKTTASTQSRCSTKGEKAAKATKSTKASLSSSVPLLDETQQKQNNLKKSSAAITLLPIGNDDDKDKKVKEEENMINEKKNINGENTSSSSPSTTTQVVPSVTVSLPTPVVISPPSNRSSNPPPTSKTTVYIHPSPSKKPKESKESKGKSPSSIAPSNITTIESPVVTTSISSMGNRNDHRHRGDPSPDTQEIIRSPTQFLKGYMSYHLEAKNFYKKYSLSPSSHKQPLVRNDSLKSLNITATCYAVYDALTMSPVVCKNHLEPIEIASISKVMTCYLCLLMCRKYSINPAQHFTRVSDRAKSMPGTSATLEGGDTISLEDLLYGLMLPSGNDASVAIAECMGKVVIKHKQKETKKTPYDMFIFHMNILAKELKLEEQEWQNPSGLQSQPNYSTPEEISFLTILAMQMDEFRQIVSTREHEVEVKNERYGLKRKIIWRNTNKLLFRENDKWEGVKTGTTYNAGHCLMAKKGRFVISVYDCQELSMRFTECARIYEFLEKWEKQIEQRLLPRKLEEETFEKEEKTSADHTQEKKFEQQHESEKKEEKPELSNKIKNNSEEEEEEEDEEKEINILTNNNSNNRNNITKTKTKTTITNNEIEEIIKLNQTKDNQQSIEDD